jgi:hypothetical protein
MGRCMKCGEEAGFLMSICFDCIRLEEKEAQEEELRAKSEKIPADKARQIKRKALMYAVLLGPLGVHRLYLRSWTGLPYLPALLTGIVLTDSPYTFGKFFGWFLLLILCGAYIVDIILILRDKLRLCCGYEYQRKGFIWKGLGWAVGLWFIICILLILLRWVPVPPA